VQWVVGRLQPNSSFKPTPLHGIVLSFGVRLLSLRLHLVAARLNSGVSAHMKLLGIVLIAFLVACTAPHAALTSFKLHDSSESSPPSPEQLDQISWIKSTDGEWIATIWVTVTNSQNPAKASAWLQTDRGTLTLCYKVPERTPVEMPPLTTPNVTYAAAAWIVPLDFHIHGLSAPPKRVLASDSCNER